MLAKRIRKQHRINFQRIVDASSIDFEIKKKKMHFDDFFLYIFYNHRNFIDRLLHIPFVS